MTQESQNNAPVETLDAAQTSLPETEHCEGCDGACGCESQQPETKKQDLQRYAGKKALCIVSARQLQAAYGNGLNDEKTIDAYLYDRSVCEDHDMVHQGVMQVIPYVTFFGYEDETSALSVLTYERPEQTTEEGLKQQTSIGFGGHIDADIKGDVLGENAPLPDGAAVGYKMSSRDLTDTVEKNAAREVQEEIGYTMPAGEKPTTTFFFRPKEAVATPVDLIHLGQAILIKKQTLELDSIADNGVAFVKANNNKEVENLRVQKVRLYDFFIDYGHSATTVEEFCTNFIGQFSVNLSTEFLTKVIQAYMVELELKTSKCLAEQGYESWSVLVLTHLIMCVFDEAFVKAANVRESSIAESTAV